MRPLGAALALAACGAPPVDESDPDPSDGPVITGLEARTGADGRALVPLDIPVGTTHLQLAIEAPSWVRVEAVRDPSGRLVAAAEDWDDARVLSGAFLWAPRAVVLGWPARAEDGPLAAGRWTVEIAVTDDFFAPFPAADLALALALKADPDPRRGAATLVLHAAPGVDPTLAQAVADEVVAVWARHGVRLDAILREDGPAGAPLVDGFGWDGFLDGTPGAIDAWLLEGLQPTNPGLLAPLAVTGTTPLGLLPSRHAGIALGLAPFGPEPDPSAVALTLAHELGHALGLPHPVGYWPGTDDVTWWDALDDTPECDNRPVCEATLGGNLLYPFALPQAAGQLTPDQAAAAHGWAGLD